MKKWLKRAFIFIISIVLILGFALMLFVINLLSKIKSGQIDVNSYLNINYKQTNNFEQLNNSDNYFLGSTTAAVEIKGFLDFQCPYCIQSLLTIKRFFSESRYSNKVKFVFYHFPLVDSHPLSLKAAMAAECAGEQQQFWEMVEKIIAEYDSLSLIKLKLFGVQLNLNNIDYSACLETNKYLSRIQNDFNSGVEVGVKATPTFLVQNQKIEGPPDIVTLEQIIESLLSNN